MALNSGPYALTLNTAQLVPNPTASSSVAATTAQIQNASPFTLEIQTNGQQIIIQQFTAQTITLDGSGSPLTILPIAGPGGTQGGLTVVWLNPGQSPDMADGQLTGAAQYAQGLGSVVYEDSTTVPVGGVLTLNGLNLSPTCRTLTVRMGTASEIPNLEVVGTSTGFPYYNQDPYLYVPTNFTTVSVIPINGLIEPVINVTVTGAAGEPLVILITQDTAAYNESLFYSGHLQVASAGLVTGTALILTGACRLLTAQLAASTAGGAGSIENAAGDLLLTIQSVSGNGPGATSINFPPNTILAAGDELKLVGTAGNTFAQVGYAYP